MSEVNVPEGYKQTEVGFIPKDWEMVRLEEIARFLKGSGLPKSDISDYAVYPCIHYGQLFTHYKEKISSISSYTNYRGKVNSLSNDILMPTSDVTPNGLATASCLLEDNIILGGDILVIRSNPNILDGVFFSYLVHIYREQVMRLVTGSTVYHLYASDMKNFSFGLPGIEEQVSIRNALSDIDNLIQSLEKLIAKKEAIKTGTMQQLLTGKTRLPEFASREDGSPKGFKQTELGRIPEDWEVSTLGNIAIFLKGSGLPKSDLVDDGQYSCIHYGQLFTLYQELILEVKSLTNIDGNIKSISNDVLMPTSDVTPNGLATASCILENNVVLGGDILIIRANPKILNGVYFAYLINIYREQVMRLVTGSTVYHLYGNTMSKLTINLPNAKEQTAIATILADMDAEIQALQHRLEKTKDIKQGMMQQLLTGKVRLAH